MIKWRLEPILKGHTNGVPKYAKYDNFVSPILIVNHGIVSPTWYSVNTKRLTGPRWP